MKVIRISPGAWYHMFVLILVMYASTSGYEGFTHAVGAVPSLFV
jgi:hypothetical protein